MEVVLEVKLVPVEPGLAGGGPWVLMIALMSIVTVRKMRLLTTRDYGWDGADQQLVEAMDACNGPQTMG